MRKTNSISICKTQPPLQQKVSKKQAPVNWKIVLERYHSMLALLVHTFLAFFY